jgi:hypothetical protein
MRGGLVSLEEYEAALFWFLTAFVGALRGIALIGPIADLPRLRLSLLALSLVIAAGTVIGVAQPDSMRTLLLGVLPVLLGTVALAFVLGKCLRVVQVETNLNWQTTCIVLAALIVERGSSWLVARAAQGQL